MAEDRKTDDGSAGPRPHGVKNGELIEELEARQRFLRKAHAKVVEAPRHEKPKGSRSAQTK